MRLRSLAVASFLFAASLAQAAGAPAGQVRVQRRGNTFAVVRGKGVLKVRGRDAAGRPVVSYLAGAQKVASVTQGPDGLRVMAARDVTMTVATKATYRQTPASDPIEVGKAYLSSSDGSRGILSLPVILKEMNQRLAK